MPRQRPLIPDCSSWILPLSVSSASAAISFFPAGSHNMLPFFPLLGVVLDDESTRAWADESTKA